ALRDPNATGPAFAAQADALQRRAAELTALYEKVIALQPQSVEARVSLAEVNFVFLSQFEMAEILLKQALEIDSASPKALIAMAEFQFFFKGDRAAAIQRIEQALSTRPGHPDLSITLADLLTGASLKPEDFARAKAQLTQALQLAPQNGDLRYMLASVWYRESLLDPKQMDHAKAGQALEMFQALLQERPDPELLVEVVQLLQSLGKLPEARGLIEQGIAKFPDEAHLRLLSGDLWLAAGAKALDQGQPSPETEQAEAIYRALLTPAQLSRLVTGQQVQLYYNLGLLSALKAQAAKAQPPQALAHYQEAEKMYRQAMAIFDRINIINSPLQLELAKTLEAIGQLQASQGPAQAADYYRQACGFKLESSCNWLKQQGLGP
ncbi:MAG: hypothetical protein CVV27_15195, partial [Candidatus Melainabacteria bacterium HGW-Melainabacteria-1]